MGEPLTKEEFLKLLDDWDLQAALGEWERLSKAGPVYIEDLEW